MKTFAIVILTAALCLAAEAQTKIADSQVAPPAGLTGPSITILLPDGTKRAVLLDAGLTLDASTIPWRLKIIIPASQPSALIDADLSRNADETWSLPSDPTGTVIIFRNGVKQKSPVDYTRAGRVVTFIDALVPLPKDDSVTAIYQ